MVIGFRRYVSGVGAMGGVAVAAAMIGLAGTPTAHADDPATDIAAAAASANQYDPAVFDYSADPTNIFSPVYTITPTGAETVISTDASGDVYGTQDFSVSYFGFPVDSFTGSVEYANPSSPLNLLGNAYVEDINMTGVPGTVLPDNTGFLVEEFGGGYGNVLEESFNSTGSSTTSIGDFLLTPYGDDNITQIINYLMNFTGTITGAASAVDPSSFTDLLTSIGL